MKNKKQQGGKMNKSIPGGLTEIEIKILQKILQKNGKLRRYGLAKILGIDKKKVYRIVKRFVSFGYVKIESNGKLFMNKLGINLLNELLSKNANRFYKKRKTKEDMVNISCTKCGKKVKTPEITCEECSEKELKEFLGEENTCPCDYCEKELLGRTADQEITLFYKDADKDFNFCSKDCLLNFIKNKLR